MKTGGSGLPELQLARQSGARLLAAAFVFSVFVNLLMLTGPIFMLQIYDRVLASRSEETLVALFLLVALLYGVMGLLDYARGRVLARFGARFQAGLEHRVFHASLKQAQHSGQTAAQRSGQVDLDTIGALLSSPAALALFDVPWTPLFVAAIFVLHPWLGWAAVFGATTLFFFAWLNHHLTRHKAHAARQAMDRANDIADQARQSADVIRSQAMGAAVSQRWQAARDVALAQSVRASDWAGFFAALTKSFRLLLQSAMLALGAWLTLQGQTTGGAMIASSILLGRAMAPVEQTIGHWRILGQSVAGWHRLALVLQGTPPDLQIPRLPRPEPRLSVQGVSVFAPGQRHPVLINISFALSPGQALGIIGKSGSGKSTLAKALLGLYPPTTGEIRLGGATLHQYDLGDFGSFVGYLPQEITLFDGTLAQNIARMSNAPDPDKVIQAARRANAHDMILSLPDGYETLVERGNILLSGGQRQRVALARAFYDDPVLLILDEPNSALDSDGAQALNQAIRAFKSSGRTVIIMTHRPTAISECDTLLVLDRGRVQTIGPKGQILRSMMRNVHDMRQSTTQAQRS
jgi:PrtD family type I secretion system ABC transporter